jgi:hypothetical protein
VQHVLGYEISPPPGIGFISAKHDRSARSLPESRLDFAITPAVRAVLDEAKALPGRKWPYDDRQSDTFVRLQAATSLP